MTTNRKQTYIFFWPYHVFANSQNQMLSEMGHYRDVGLACETTLDQSHMFTGMTK